MAVSAAHFLGEGVAGGLAVADHEREVLVAVGYLELASSGTET